MNADRVSPRRRTEQAEHGQLSSKAAFSDDPNLTQRQYPLEPDNYRTQFQRDYTRILHSRAFRRLRHKTQVFISPKNDHLCSRMEHSLHVASVACTIAQALDLNQDLVRAIAIGHDLGHAPFGHIGEESLRTVAKKYGLSFWHEKHSLRIVDHLESPYRGRRGLNLTFAVRDGIVCHHGEGFEQSIRPNRKKTPEALKRPLKAQSPRTLEGCVVRWADKVAYLGRDLDDAVALNLVKISHVPGNVRRTLGSSNREIIGRLIQDLVKNGIDKDCLCVTVEVYDALNELKDFNYDRIYRTELARASEQEIREAMQMMFAVLLRHLKESQGDRDALRRSHKNCLAVFADFLKDDVRQWKHTPSCQIVLDFIAGMTDAFFIDSFSELFLPKSVV